MRIWLVVVALCVAGAERAWAADPAGRLDDDQKLLWEEALATHDGWLYTFTERTFPTEESARACWTERLLPACSGASERVKRVHVLAVELPAAVRERVRALDEGDMSPPFVPEGGGWMTVELEERGVARGPPGQDDPAGWLALHAGVALPTAEALRDDPVLRQRSVLNRLRSRGDLEAALGTHAIAVADLDRPTSDGATALLHAVDADDRELAEALLTRGASADACGASICPLAKAVKYHRAQIVPALLAHGANPSGTDEARVSPLMWAAFDGDCATARQLLDAGADPLRHWAQRASPGPVRRRSLLYFVTEEEHPECAAKLVEVVHQALVKGGAYRWSAWIEQGKRRMPVKDGATIPLARAPFRLVFRVATPATAFRVAASPDPALLARARRFEFRRDLTHGMRVGAANADARWLSVKRLAPLDAADRADSLEFTTTEVGWTDDAEWSFGTRRQVQGGAVELVHDFEQLVTEEGEIPVAEYQGKVIAVVMGPLPPGSGGEFFEPARFTLRFK